MNSTTIARRLNTAFERTEQAAAFKHAHGRYPSQIDSTKKAIKLGNWLSNMRQAKKGLVSNTWYPECELLAIGLGCTDMFDFDRSIMWIPAAMKYIKDLAEYHGTYGEYPHAGKNKKHTQKVMKMGFWLRGMRGAKINAPGEYIWRPEYESMAINLGCDDMFERPPRRKLHLALRRTRQIAEYKEQYDKYPTSRSENGLVLSTWLSDMRRARAGVDSVKHWFPECGQLAKELNCADMFDRKIILRGGEARTIAVIEYHRKYGKYPSSCDSDEHYRQLAGWLKRLRGAKRGRGLEPTTKWRPECDVLAKEMGYPDLFDYQTK